MAHELTQSEGQITGLVLAGGRGSRMGGVDKGLQGFGAVTLAEHALRKLSAQVGPCLISANRNLATYRAMGVPVWPDAHDSEQAGPLAGLLMGLQRASTPWLLAVPCDAPDFPDDLARRLLAAAVADHAEVAIAATRSSDGEHRLQPAFCLARTRLAGDLAEFLAAGERKMAHWTRRHRRVEVVFDKADAFVNLNTWDELAQLNTGR